MEKYGQRVARAREHVGWSQTKLAREIGITQPAISELEAGEARSSKHSYKISQKTGVDTHWLETGEGDMLSGRDGMAGTTSARAADAKDLTNSKINIQAMPRDVPILGGASCGDDGLFELNGQVLDYARRPPRLDNVRDAYAVYVEGESMSPWREHGDLVYVQPHQPINIGDYVVVQLVPDKDGETSKAYIKRLVRRTAKDLILQQFKPAGQISLPMKRVKSTHRILPWSELLGL